MKTEEIPLALLEEVGADYGSSHGEADAGRHREEVPMKTAEQIATDALIDRAQREAYIQGLRDEIDYLANPDS